MTRSTWFPVLIGLTLLSGCARTPGAHVPPTASQDASSANLGGPGGEKSLDLVIQAPADGSPAAWTRGDIDLFRIVLKDGADTLIHSVDLPQKNLPAGESPRSTLRFERLRHGETYHASVLAMRGGQVINSQSPTTLTFAFTGEQDIEDTLSRSAIILLDDRRFSGTMRIPVNGLRSKFSGSSPNDHQNNSTSMNVSLEALTWDGRKWKYVPVYTKDYPRPPGSWYPDYKLVNLSYGVTYRVTLTSTYKQGQTTKTNKVDGTFMPFSDTSTDSYDVPTNKFQ